MNYQKWVVWLSIIWGLTGCISSPTKPAEPAWINTPPIKENFRYGVGSAEIYGDKVLALEQAKDRARANLMKQLKVEVSSTNISEMSERSDGNRSEFQSTFRSEVQTRLPKIEVSGLKIEETHVDKKIAYALMSLDLSGASKNARNQISNIDVSLQDYTQVPNSLDSLNQLNKLLPALELIEKRKQLQEQVITLSMGSSTTTSENRLHQQIEERIYDLLGKLKITVQALNPEARDMQPRLIQQLTEAGLRVASKDADIIIEFGLKTREMSGEMIYAVFAEGNINIKDAHGTILKSYTGEVKGASSNQGRAYDQAVKKIALLLGEQLTQSLLSGL